MWLLRQGANCVSLYASLPQVNTGPCVLINFGRDPSPRSPFHPEPCLRSQEIRYISPYSARWRSGTGLLGPDFQLHLNRAYHRLCICSTIAIHQLLYIERIGDLPIRWPLREDVRQPRWALDVWWLYRPSVSTSTRCIVRDWWWYEPLPYLLDLMYGEYVRFCNLQGDRRVKLWLSRLPGSNSSVLWKF